MARLSSPSLELKTVNFTIDQITAKGLLKSERDWGGGGYMSRKVGPALPLALSGSTVASNWTSQAESPAFPIASCHH